jgi:uncharacterized protein YkwD
MRIVGLFLCGVVGLVGAPGCGGDGGGDDDGTVPAGGYCDPVSGWSVGAAAFENEIVTLVNQHRAAGATCGGEAKPAVPALSADAALRCAARVHTRDMADRDFFDHTNPDGQLPWDRMELAGYAWGQAGENIAGGNATATATMTQWMNSTGHCNNIMSGDFVDIGVGYVEDAALWTQVFGAPR